MFYFKCLLCFKDFTRLQRGRKNGVFYCSRLCANKSPKRSEKIRVSKIGVKNHQWKGDKVKYGALHDWVKWHINKSQKCSDCFKKKKLDLCNISGQYKRDLKDWEWLCRRCHMIKDGRLEKLVKINARMVSI